MGCPASSTVRMCAVLEVVQPAVWTAVREVAQINDPPLCSTIAVLPANGIFPKSFSP